MHKLVVPLIGSLVVVTLASVLISVVLRSPYTHANLWETVPASYTRTSPILVGQEVGDVELALDGEAALAGNRITSLGLVGPVAGIEGLQAGNGSAIEQGRAVYLTRACATCHGLDAGGGPVGPSLAGSSPETVQRMVREGRGGMPAYSEEHLTDAGLAELSTYLSGLDIARPSSEDIAALQRLTYDPFVPKDVLLKGKVAIRRSCGACHVQPDKEDIVRAFSSDAQAAGLVAEMVYETNLSLEDAKAITYYMLAIVNGADPMKAPPP